MTADRRPGDPVTGFPAIQFRTESEWVEIEQLLRDALRVCKTYGHKALRDRLQEFIDREDNDASI